MRAIYEGRALEMKWLSIENVLMQFTAVVMYDDVWWCLKMCQKIKMGAWEIRVNASLQIHSTGAIDSKIF